MNTICIYIDDDLDHNMIENLKTELMGMPHVFHVQMQDARPHDVAVEFESHHNVPMSLLQKLGHKGLHADIFSC